MAPNWPTLVSADILADQVRIIIEGALSVRFTGVLLSFVSILAVAAAGDAPDLVVEDGRVTVLSDDTTLLQSPDEGLWSISL